jgi:hypothetical protein
MLSEAKSVVQNPRPSRSKTSRRISRNYFAVFESNAAKLGKIGDKDLREKIIRVHLEKAQRTGKRRSVTQSS